MLALVVHAWFKCIHNAVVLCLSSLTDFTFIYLATEKKPECDEKKLLFGMTLSF